MNTDFATKNEEMHHRFETATLLVRNSVKPARFEHSVRTAQTAQCLCKQYGEDTDWGIFAGLVHDICKDMDDATVIELTKNDGFAITALEHAKPSLLHGRAGAVLLKSDFGQLPDAVLEAVQNHTFGRAGMSNLAKIIYIADKIEPGRNYDTAAYTPLMQKLSLNELCARVITQNIAFLLEKGKTVSPLSRAFLKSVGNLKNGSLEKQL